MVSVSISDTPTREKSVRVTHRIGNGYIHIHIIETVEVRNMNGIPFNIETGSYYLSMPIETAKELNAKLGKALQKAQSTHP